MSLLRKEKYGSAVCSTGSAGSGLSDVRARGAWQEKSDMSVIDLETPPLKRITPPLKPVTDRVTRERAEHPDRTPRDATPHPVTGVLAERRRPRNEER
jgi:hypothetical protein